MLAVPSSFTLKGTGFLTNMQKRMFFSYYSKCFDTPINNSIISVISTVYVDYYTVVVKNKNKKMEDIPLKPLINVSPLHMFSNTFSSTPIAKRQVQIASV